MLGALRVLPKVAVASTPPVAGYVAWFDAADAASITSSGGAVSQWNDKASSPNHATQSTAGKKPTTGSVTINGLNALAFDGGDLLTFALTSVPSAITALAVVRTTTTSGIRSILGTQSAGAGPFQWRCDGTSNRQTLLSYASSNIGTSATGLTNNTAAQVTIQFQAATSRSFWLNAAADGTGSTGTSLSGSGGSVIGAQNTGPGEPWIGDIAELIIYHSALSTGDRQSVESYLKTKWGTP